MQTKTWVGKVISQQFLLQPVGRRTVPSLSERQNKGKRQSLGVLGVLGVLNILQPRQTGQPKLPRPATV